MDNEGETPLMVSCKTGRVDNIKYIIETLSKNSNYDETNPVLKKLGIAGINKPQKNTWCPIHLAVLENRVEAVKALISYKVDLEKQLSTKFDKVGWSYKVNYLVFKITYIFKF